MRIDRVDDLVKRKRRRCKKTSSFWQLGMLQGCFPLSTDLVSKAISEDCSEGDICSILENSALMSFLGGVEKKMSDEGFKETDRMKKQRRRLRTWR
jgi:hypothetical protein